MSYVDKLKRKMVGIEIPRDELACRIAEASMGAKRPMGATAAEALAEAEKVDPGQAKRWRDAADRAVMFFHECIKAGEAVN